MTYELQPLSYTSLRLLSGPPRGGGGDTLWASHYGAYDLLSPQMQKYLESLTALHSADLQADGSRAAGRPLRREPVTTEHPLVRTHPVTGWKSLFYSPGFITVIVGIPKTESDAIIRYLNDLISTTQEIHARFQWQQYDVAFWDNRVTVSRSSIPCEYASTDGSCLALIATCPESHGFVRIRSPSSTRRPRRVSR